MGLYYSTRITADLEPAQHGLGRFFNPDRWILTPGKIVDGSDSRNPARYT
jgi:hypothetical protein